MALNIEAKKAIVAEVAQVASAATSSLAAEYRGLTVEQMNKLRVQARESGIYLKVIRNTLAKRAIEGTEHECMQPILVGPLILAFAKDEPSAPARLAKAFAKDNEHFKVTAISLGGQLHEANQLSRIASLPTKDEAIAQLMGVLQAPVTKLARTLNEPHAKLTRTFAALRDKLQS